MYWEEIYTRLANDREDSAAWSTLQQRVRAWALADLRGSARAHVDDIVADACSGVAVAFHRARGPETFHGFVLGHCLNARRRSLRERRFALVGIDDVEIAAHDEPDGPTLGQLQQLQQALRELPDRERKAVVMRFYGERSGAQIAIALGVSEVNARRLVFNGVTSLRRRFGATMVGRA